LPTRSHQFSLIASLDVHQFDFASLGNTQKRPNRFFL
jgi:hypothetical protein